MDRPRTVIRSGSAAKLELVLLAVVGVVAVVLRLELLATRSLWHDEAFSLAVARKPTWYILQRLPAADPHPPGYYLLLRGVLLALGDTVLAGRTLSAALGVAAVLLTWWLARSLFDRSSGLAAAALVGLNPFQVFASNEIRMYPLATCLALLSTWCAWRAALTDRPARWVVYGASLAAMAYVSYYTALVAVGQWLWLMWMRRWRGMVLSAVVAFLIFAPWLEKVPGSVLGIVTVHEKLRASHVIEVFSTQAYGGYLFGSTTYLATGGFDPRQHTLLVVPFAALALAGFVALAPRHGREARLVTLVWGCGLGLWTLASLVLSHLAAYPRHLVFLQPFLAMLIGAGIVHFGEAVARFSGTKTAAGVALLVLSFLWPALNNLQASPEYQWFRYDRAAALVRALYRPGDALVFYHGGGQGVFREYFQPGGLQIAIDPQPDRWSRDGMRPLLRKAVEPLRRAKGRVWLVLAWPYPPDSPLDLIEAVEALGYRRVTRQSFQGLDVVVLARPGAQ